MLAAVALAVGGLGCASARGAARGAAGMPAIDGIWEGFSQGTVADGLGAGDTRIERQAWRLRQNGNTISGFYVVELTMISGDGRPYLCSREPKFSTLLRFEVRGQASSSGLEIEEVGDVLSRGPCRPTVRTPARFRGEVQGDVLTLIEGEHRFTLYRRPPNDQKAATAQLLAFERPDSSWTGEPTFPRLQGVELGAAAGPPVDVRGLWIWEHRGRMPTGDEKQEREEWHLEQEGTRISGYYDRAVRQVSTDGNAYRCSNSLEFRVVTRYQVTGEVQGNRIVLYERHFEILEGSPCDNGQRRLDAYQGEASLGEIHLIWGVGRQVLKRARPNIPTQRF
jgi:hypothetical protein